MRKVKLQFTLTGKSTACLRKLPAHIVSEVKNRELFDYVKDLVVDQFGERALYIDNEDILKGDTRPYPACYSAGWFVSDDEENMSELVVLAHGDNMEKATKAMFDVVSTTDWNSLAAEV